ncbi:Glutamate N-acetyltransferase [Acidisarcina polymorpha]|uniref:Arginine biosynthesis bifunctional protein ArgJ n=1 Tax=Acidisarcina polymorpha TaxID=2211140 RepID=A0A2Z5G8F6_9BACT|nr:bifunctional glutamate N-acetyltransferase/amino-acid acetyltransferase ArgJ [Acidisarcina polymorpha]AXC15280.1 Glutamate N-acetyltransferase [Acidisarcina polymorpha]
MISSPHIPDFLLPSGFQFTAVSAGIKPSGKPDFAIVVADEAASAAAMFTSNRVTAAPLTVGREHLRSSGGRVKVVVVNAGNANCATGEAGVAVCREVCARASATFGGETMEVFPSSTGIIGVPLPGDKLIAALPLAKSDLGRTSGHFDRFAHAILTTDTRRKVSARHFTTADGQQVKIVGVCKGAGMIHPQLVPHATMLAYIFTDAVIAPEALQALLGEAVESSFNRISIDGDTSTNDTVLLLASGAGGVTVDATHAEFREALYAVATDLAKQIVADGEGVTHVIELQIEGATSDAEALKVAKAIAHSPLVKTAWAGTDPNWGRILAAIGYSGVHIDPDRVSIWFGEHEICRNGGRSASFDEAAAHTYISQPEFRVRIDLGAGHGSCRFWTCDLTAEYVRINASYST